MSDLKTAPDMFFAYARNNVAFHTEADRVLKTDGLLSDSARESAAAVGNFFESVFCQDDHLHMPSHYIQIPDLHITATLVRAHFERIFTNNSSESDNLHTQFLNAPPLMTSKPFASSIHIWRP